LGRNTIREKNSYQPKKQGIEEALEKGGKGEGDRMIFFGFVFYDRRTL
jgi:hypothetical protein